MNSTADVGLYQVIVKKRHTPVIEAVRKTVGYRHAWWLIVAGLAGGKRQYLKVSAGISQISDVLGPNVITSFYSLSDGIEKNWLFIPLIPMFWSNIVNNDV